MVRDIFVNQLVLSAYPRDMSPHAHRPLMAAWVAIALAVVAGILRTSQARINGAFALEINDAFISGAISFGSGFLILLVIISFNKKGQRGWRELMSAIKSGGISGWFTLAGSAGAAYVLSQTLVIGITGVALYTVAFVAGLSMGGLFLDVWGIGPAGKKPLSLNRVGGATLGIGAVALSLVGQSTAASALLPLLLPLICGVLVAWQDAANGRMTVVAGTPLTSTFLNFAVGTGVLLIAAAFHSFSAGLPPSLPTQPYFYLGGAIGVVFIGITAVVVREIGVLLMGLGSIAGQLLMAVILDYFYPSAQVTGLMILVGASLAFVAAAWAGWPAKKPHAHGAVTAGE